MTYMIIVVVILILFIWFMPKKLDKRDMLIIWISTSYTEIVVDLYLDKGLDLYYFATSNELQIRVLTMKLFTAPLFGLIYLNFMPKDFKKFIPYWFGWAIFSTMFEWTTTYFGYLTYTGWHLLYSLLFYIAILPIVRWYYLYIKH